MNELEGLEQFKHELPKEIFDKFKAELESTQGRMLRLWLWRVFLMCVLPWRWKFLVDMIRSGKENKRYWNEHRSGR